MREKGSPGQRQPKCGGVDPKHSSRGGLQGLEELQRLEEKGLKRAGGRRGRREDAEGGNS